MGMNELEGYLGEIREAQRKYNGKITIYKSLEIEYFEDLEDYYRELAQKLDYLFLGLHTYVVNGKLRDSWIINTDEDMINYALHMEKAMKSKLFQIAAHPDFIYVKAHDMEQGRRGRCSTYNMQSSSRNRYGFGNKC